MSKSYSLTVNLFLMCFNNKSIHTQNYKEEYFKNISIIPILEDYWKKKSPWKSVTVPEIS